MVMDYYKSCLLLLSVQELIYQEFFRQGDMEKSLGRNPLDMMDRDKAHIPELQVGFLNGIALPVFRYVALLLDISYTGYDVSRLIKL